MKQIIITFLLGVFCFPISSNAQIQLSGDIGIKYTNSGDAIKLTYYNITPKIGFELDERITIGGFVGYTGVSLKADGFVYPYTSNESFGIVNFGVYSRFNTIGSDKIRLLFEPSFGLALETEGGDFMLSFSTVPVIQMKVTEKVYFDMTLGLMGLSVASIPDANYTEINFGINNNSTLSDLGLYGMTSSLIIPLQFGFTFVF